MKINLDYIQANPHRNLEKNPLDTAQIEVLKESILRNEWGENVIVRVHPTRVGHFELGYGHTRLAALKQLRDSFKGLEKDNPYIECEFIVKRVTDWGMYSWMVDENESQHAIKPNVVFENVGAGIAFLTQLIEKYEKVGDFLSAVQRKTVDIDESGYALVRNNLFKGSGLGVSFLTKMLPGERSTNRDNIQSVVDAYYKNTKAEATHVKAQEKVKEASVQREAIVAKKAKVTRAKSAVAFKKDKVTAVKAKINTADTPEQKSIFHTEITDIEKEIIIEEKKISKEETKVKKAETAVAEISKQATDLYNTAKKLESCADEEVLRLFDTVATMSAFAKGIKEQKIPKEYHLKLAKYLIELSNPKIAGRLGYRGYPETIAAWWYKASGKHLKDLKNREREIFRKKHQNVTIDEFAEKIPSSVNDLIKQVDAITPYTDQITNEVLKKNLSKLFDKLTASMDAYTVQIVSSNATLNPEILAIIKD